MQHAHAVIDTIKKSNTIIMYSICKHIMQKYKPNVKRRIYCPVLHILFYILQPANSKIPATYNM